MAGHRKGPRPWALTTAWRKIERRAAAMGYAVCREEREDGVVTLSLLWLGQPAHIRLVDVVPNDTPEDPARRLAVITSGLAIPYCVTPATVDSFLEELAEFERSIA